MARHLKIPPCSLNELAFEHEAVERGHEVSSTKLEKILRTDMKTSSLIYGHLLPYVAPKDLIERIAVLRCEPKVLKTRLLQRGYREEKVLQNVESELIGAISVDCFTRFGASRVSEFDTTTTSSIDMSESITRYFKDGGHCVIIDWLPFYSSVDELKRLLSRHPPGQSALIA